MTKIMNLYCDESCHLENDHNKVMVLGAVSCPFDEKDIVFSRIRELKAKHGLGNKSEAKWVKVSQNKIEFYLDLVDYFFDTGNLSFRVLVVPDKTKLEHEKHKQTHDEFYYKMYFSMLKGAIVPSKANNIFIDIKETYGGQKINRLQTILRNDYYDFQEKIINKIQIIRSHDVEIMQLTDLLIGAVCYENRGLATNTSKKAIIDKIKAKTGYSLKKTTYMKEDKFNILIWKAKDQQE